MTWHYVDQSERDLITAVRRYAYLKEVNVRQGFILFAIGDTECEAQYFGNRRADAADVVAMLDAIHDDLARGGVIIK
jgi:hypothetical protein